MVNFFKAYRFKKIDLTVFIVFLTAAILFIWIYRFLPMQDYPDWLFQGSIFSKIITGNPIEGYNLIWYPVPNSISTILIGLFDLLFSSEISGKVFLTVYVIVFIFSSFYLISSTSCVKKISPIYYLPFLLIFNYPFFHGNLNYILSLSALFFAIGYLNKFRDNFDRINIWFLLITSTVIYFSHAISYFVYLIFIGNILIFNFKKSMFKKILLGLAPSLIMLVIYMLNQLYGLRNSEINFQLFFSAKTKVYSLMKYFSLFHRFDSFQHVPNNINLISIINISFCFGFFILYIFGFKVLFKPRNRIIGLTSVLCIFAFLVSPTNVLGVIVNPDQRFLYPSIWLFLACLSAEFVDKMSDKIRRITKCFLFSLFFLQMLFLNTYIPRISHEMADVYLKLKQSKEFRSQFYTINETHFRDESKLQQKYPLIKLLPRHSPLARLPYYINIEEGSYAKIMPTGLIKEKGITSKIEAE